jgi:hypothetical protein
MQLLRFGSLVRPVLVLAFLCTGSCSKRASKPADDAHASSMTDLYGLKKVPTFDLKLSENDIAALRKSPKEWRKGTFAYEGQVFKNVALRIKGHRSLRSIDKKPAFKLRFDKGKKNKGRRFLGVNRLTLNNLVEDPTMIREYLAYRLAREVGLPVPKAGFANLRVNGAPYGLYLVVETPDTDFLTRQFGSAAGELYEGEYGCDITTDDVEGFDRDVGGDDRTSLRHFAKAAEGDGEAMATSLWRSPESPIDLEHLSLFLAFSTYVGDFDGYHHSHNYRIYRNPKDNKWQFMSWGLDRAWFKEVAPYASRGLLAKKCFAHHECRRAYVLALRRVHKAAQTLNLAVGAKVISSIISEDVNADNKRPHSAKTIMKRRQRLLEFIEGRERYVAEHTQCLDAAGNEVDLDGDGYGCMDCDDSNAKVHPGATELCDGIDNDCTGLANDAAACACPEHVIDGETYALCDLPMPFADAREQCNARGGELAKVTTLEALKALRSLAKPIREERWWLGGSDREVEGTFTWLDKTPIAQAANDQTMWAKGEPDNTGCNQDCIVLPTGSAPKLHDTHCGQHLPFVCQMAKAP